MVLWDLGETWEGGSGQVAGMTEQWPPLAGRRMTDRHCEEWWV